MNQEIIDMSIRKYRDAIDEDSYDKNKKGFIVLKPTAKLADQKSDKLVTDIEILEKKLKSFKETKVKMDEAKSDNKSDKRGKKDKKKRKKEKETLLKMVFSSPTEEVDDDDEDPEMGEYSDKKSKAKNKDKKIQEESKINLTELESVYSKRFSPVVSLLFDSITEFDKIADDLEDELATKASSTKGMYRSSQTSNLIAAKKAKLDSVKELANISKTITDLENKKAKDENKEDDPTKAITALGTRLLRGSLFGEEEKEKKKGKKEKERKLLDDDDEDDNFFKNKKASDRELSDKFRESVFNKKNKFQLTPYERHIEMEGKYQLWIVADSMDMENDWKFMAVDKKGKELKDFKDEYKDLIPKKKDCKMVFDTNKMKVIDKNTNKSYKLVFSE